MNCSDKYISKKECKSLGYTKKGKCFYKMSVLEKYLSKGWLEYGNSKYSGGDRYRAGMSFYSDYLKGHKLGMISSSWGSEKIDCKRSGTDNVSVVTNRYFKSLKTIPVEFREVVYRVCIEDRDIEVVDIESERRRLEMSFSMKRDLCRGLDRLIELYFYSNVGE